MKYQDFIAAKAAIAPESGMDIGESEINPICLPHQRAIIKWAIKGGRRAIFAAFGLGKTVIQLEIVRIVLSRIGGRGLIIAPLGVRQEFMRDAKMLGIELRFIRRIEEADANGIYLCNYETVRDGKLDPREFDACALDEASCLRGFGGSKTFREFMRLIAGDGGRGPTGTGRTADEIKYRFVLTATPSPNDFIELLAYSAFLGIMDVEGAKTRFFKRDSTKADKLTLHAHKEQEFWLWVASWALFIERPSDVDVSFSDEGYDLPPLRVVWHELPTDHDSAGEDMDGQARMFRNAALGLSEAAREKRDSLPDRTARMVEIIAEAPEKHYLIWHDLEAERHAIEQAVPSSVSVYGSQDLDERERAIIGFSDGEIKILAAKPSIAGSGCNFQRHCHRAIYLGIGFKFNDFIQSVHRIRRYLQTRECVIDLIFTEAEREIRAVLMRKWKQHEKLVAEMTSIVRRYGLSTAAMHGELKRGMGVERRVAEGPTYTVVNNDCVDEMRRVESDSIGLMVSSLPFSNQYEYSPNFNDFGHTDDNAHFWRQMDYLTPELYRALMPGRIAAIHVKDRIQPGGINGFGFQTVERFSDQTCAHFESHGFAFIARKTIVTDVVRENNQTYRLGWTEQCKDGSRMGAGLPEYVLLFRKPQTDRTKGYADIPVEKSKPDIEEEDGTIRPWQQGGENRKIVPGSGYSRSRWQLDAHGFTRSDGNRLLAPSDFTGMEHREIFQRFRAESLSEVYSFERHVAIAEELERAGILPVTFMLLQPQSWHDDVWTDIARMRTLNTFQSVKGAEMHLCLARGSLVLTREYGYKPIEEVRIGDHVLTHKGRWRPVLAVQNTGDREVVELRGHGVPGLSLTPDHKVWAKDVARFARQADYARSAEPGWLEAEKTVGGYVNRKLPPVESSMVPPSTWWVVGRWIADGHIDARGGAVISCALDEVPELETRLGEFGGNPFHQTGDNCGQILLRDPRKSLRRILAECGRGAANKRLPPVAFTLPVNCAAALLDGYLSGDGHFRPERKRWMASSISRSLLMGIAFLAHRVHGAIASVFPGRPERRGLIEGRDVAMRQDWILSFDLPAERRKKTLLLSDGAWMRVRSAEPVGIQETWNIRVDEDESFTAEGMIVKNCPLQFDIVNRLIVQLSNPGEVVLDPFGGLMTVPYCAVKAGRKGYGIELSPLYWADGRAWVERAHAEASTPTLFDLLDLEKAS